MPMQKKKKLFNEALCVLRTLIFQSTQRIHIFLAHSCLNLSLGPWCLQYNLVVKILGSLSWLFCQNPLLLAVAIHSSKLSLSERTLSTPLSLTPSIAGKREKSSFCAHLRASVVGRRPGPDLGPLYLHGICCCVSHKQTFLRPYFVPHQHPHRALPHSVGIAVCLLAPTPEALPPTCLLISVLPGVFSCALWESWGTEKGVSPSFSLFQAHSKISLGSTSLDYSICVSAFWNHPMSLAGPLHL